MKTVLLVITTLMFSTNAFTQVPISSPSSPSVEKQVRQLSLSSMNTVYFGSHFSFDSVAKLQSEIIAKSAKLRKDEAIYIVMDSGGGSIAAGLEAIDNLASLNRPVHTITMFGASMAFQTAQGLGDRLVTPSGVLMSHNGWGGFFGEFGNKNSQLGNRYNFWTKRIERLDRNTASRTNGKYTFDSYRELYENEYWCEGVDCVEDGFADEVVAPMCDASLSGETFTKEKVSFFGLDISISYKRSKCPLITGQYDVQITVMRNGKVLYSEVAYTSDVINSMNFLTSHQRVELSTKLNHMVGRYESLRSRIIPLTLR